MLALSAFNLQLSWKQKLSIVIAITLLGLLFVAGSAFIGLTSVSNSFDKQNTAVAYKQKSLALTNKLLKLESSISALTMDNTSELVGKLEGLKQLSLAMQLGADAMDNREVHDFISQIQGLNDSYKKQRILWLENRNQLGFNSNEGDLKRLFDALQALEKISISMIEDPIGDLVSSQRKYLITKDIQNEELMENALGRLEKMVADLEWEGNKIGQAVQAYRSAFQNTRFLVQKENSINATMLPLLDKLNGLIDQQNIFLDEKVLQQVEQEAKSARQAAMQIIGIAAVIVGIVIFVSLSGITRQLNVQLHTMQSFLKNVAAGDFSGRLETNNNQKDEFTQLRLATNHMVEDISGVILQVVQGNESLLSLRNKLEEDVEQLAVSSQQVEEKTQQSTVATQQISTAVNDVAKRSVGVSDTAKEASTSTQTGGEVINDCVASMVDIVDLIGKTHDEVGHLAKSSSKMLGIIDVINGLADQTNLLALNAAIESARAGEAGRGFSVVADEVRALAQKTVDATSNIGEIIQSFNDQSKRMSNLMERGIKLASSGQDNANNAMTSIESIEESIQKVTAEMDQIVVAVDEISSNSNDIATQVEQICEQSESTKETRLSMEDYTQKLSGQAESLGQLTGRFKLPNH